MGFRMSLTPMLLEPSSRETGDGDLVELYFERGWTDGLPIVPPTPDKINAVVQALGGDADFFECKVAPRWGALTRKVLAINMVMAGCKPEYVHVVRAAMLALTVQSQWCAGHDPHGFAAGNRQRSDCARDWYEWRCQRLRFRQPGECYDWPRHSADYAQCRRWPRARPL